MDNNKDMTSQVENNTEISIDQINDVVSTVESLGNTQMQDLKESVVVDTEAELEEATASIDTDTNEIDLIAKTVEDLDVDLFDAADKEALEEAAKEKMLNSAKNDLDLEDDEAYEFIKLIDDFRSNPNIPDLYNKLPKQIQMQIGKIMIDAQIPIQNRNNVAKFVLNEFVNNSEVEAAFVDFEKALNETLNIPSLVDMYGEHTREIMEKNIPEMIEKIKDGEPEKAELLQKVKDGYTKSYTLENLKTLYETSGSVRKDVRRAEINFRRCLDDFNNKNKTTRFKMYDVYEVPQALAKVLCADPVTDYANKMPLGLDVSELTLKLIELVVTDEEIKKFCTLLAVSCEDLNGEDLIDASYMYYLTKNIIMLKHTQDMAKTEFTAELINNICDIIVLIRNKEAEFYAENPHLVKSKLSKKSNSTRRGKK